MNDSLKCTGAVALVSGGIASAFALATCCALPYFFGSAALIFTPIALASEHHTQGLTVIAAIGLIGSTGMAVTAPKYCKLGSVCARPWFRWGISAAALAGLVLLMLAKIYA